MSGRNTSRDPFAGYTPVRFPSVDNAPSPDVPDIPKPKKYGSRARGKKGGIRTIVGFAQVVIFIFAVLLVAVFAYGFIYRQTFSEPSPLLGSLTNQVQRIAAAGRDLRLSFDAPVHTNAPVQVRAQVQFNGQIQSDAPTQVTNAPARPSKPRIDSALKRFYNGGRKGRTLGPKEDE